VISFRIRSKKKVKVRLIGGLYSFPIKDPSYCFYEALVMSFSWLNLKKSKNNPKPRSRFFAPDLMALESRVNPVAFTGTVNLANSGVELLMTSTGVGANANNITISNISSTTIQVDAGAGNTITLTDGTSGNLIVSGGTAQTATINLNAVQMASFKLTGNAGDDLFSISNFDGTAMQTAANFNVLVDSSTVPGGSDTFTVSGALILKGTGSLTTSNNTNSAINLAQATVSATGSISTAGTGSVLLVANSLAASNVTIASGGTITTTSGTVTMVATQTSNPTGNILLNGNAVTTNGGSINFNSNVVLQSATTINSGNSSTANITFSGSVNGANTLTLTSQGIISIAGNIGNTTALGNISISGGGTSFSVTGNVSAASLVTVTPIAGNISFGGTQNYTSAVLGLNLNTTNNGNITLGGNVTLAVNAPLQLAHDGKLFVGGNITNGVLNEVAVSSTSTVQLGINFPVTISVNQGISFNSPTTLGQNTTLVTGNGQGITFNSTLDGSRTLLLNTVGTVIFKDNVGASSVVSQINTITNNPSSLTFSNTLTPGKTLNVGVLNATTTGNIDLTVDQIFSGGGLNLTTIGTGNVTLGSVISNIGSVGGIVINNAGTLNITKNLNLDGVFSQTSAGPVTIGTSSATPLVITTRNQDISFTGPITLNTDLTINAGTASTADMTLGFVNSLGGNAFDLTMLAGGNLTLNGSLGNLTSLGAINASNVTLSSLKTGANALVINAESFAAQVSGDVSILAAQTYSSALGLNIVNTSSSALTRMAAVTTSNGGVVSITNTGVLQLQGNITSDGPVTQTGGGSVFFGVTGNPFTITTTNDAIYFTDAINLLSNTTINSNGGNITFNNIVDGDFSFTVNASGGNVLMGGRLGFNSIGPIVVNGATTVTMLGNIFAESLSIINATGPIVITGEMVFNNTTGNSLTINTSTPQATINLQGKITAPGSVFIQNAGTFTLSDSADITISNGYFTQAGTGPVSLAGDIITTGDSVALAGIATIAGGQIVNIPVLSGGSGYLAAPIVTITNGGGSGATAIANVTNGVVTSITVTNGGSGYTSSPTITIASNGNPNIYFNGPVNLSGNTLLSSTNGTVPGSIFFASTVDGLGNLAVESSGTVTFNDNLGATNRIGVLELRRAINNNPNGIAVTFNGNLNTSTLNLLNVNGEVRFLGSALVQTALNTSAGNYSLNFLGASTAIGGQANFLNAGAVRLSNTTLFSGAVSFNNAGSLEMQGIVTASGAFSVQRTVSVPAPLSLNLSSATNTISGAMTGTSTITLGGSGNLVLSANSPLFSGNFQVNTGSLQVSANYNNATVNLGGGTLKGTGQVFNVVGATGNLSPGSSLGTLTVGSQLTLTSGNTFVTQINGANIGSFGQVSVTSGVTSLGGSTLSIASATGLAAGQQITIINNGNSVPINGQFKGLVEGSSITVGNTTFTISYKGGTGNDVVLTVSSIVNPVLPPNFSVYGTDAGGGPVVQINYTNGTNLSFYAYSSSYTGGVRVAIGDVNGDGYPDLITGTGIGGGPHIKVFDLRGGQPVTIASFFAFEPQFMGGVNVASGDINGDGYADVIIGAGATGGPRVKVYSGAPGYAINTIVPAMDFFAYDPSFTGGVTVSAGNRDTQPGEEVITGAGVGGGPNIRSFNAVGQVIDNFFAFNLGITTGIFVAAGYVDSDGTADIIAGTGFGTSTQVAAFFSTGSRPTAVPFTSSFIGGARVGMVVDSLGREAFAAAAGPGGGPQVNIFNNSLATIDSYIVINPLFDGGLYMNTTL
jgi:fibronectin-binding autotransporter adhesin